MQQAIYGKADFNYLLYLPKNFDGMAKFPLVIFLHGAGECGEDLNLLKCHSIPKICDKDADFPAVIVSPQCEAGKTWDSQTDRLYSFIQYIIREYAIDENAVSITGLSMGGFGVWQMIMDYPDLFSAAAPVCGGGMSWRVPAILNLPIRIYHGENDSAVNCFYAKDMYNALKNHGAKNVELFLYPGIDHDVWNIVYEKTDAIDWLIKNRKPV